MASIYGVEITSGITPAQAREALVECFYEAHGQSTGMTMNSQQEIETVKNYCMLCVKNAFDQTGGSFESPTKESILKVVDYLARFSAYFRDPAVIEKHKNEILQVCQAIK